MADEAGVDEGDPVCGRDGGQQSGGFGDVGGCPDVEAQRPKIVLQ
ncbi:hypothetical protein P8A18_30475 [Streptomyces castrisilvae]|uniref:Uncharacterized protein n=1 Tax=Streptomyces castrisilvae TaxID=3033811 RepID=A0ABY9HSF9_9ACTN|nr:hypothetical protein [Streptomyces sp. Mut1]WLQ37502.1 hypothetical protein P8A18_30475 [Streptomyces sp. Mut1]